MAMVINQVTARDVLLDCRQVLGLPSGEERIEDDQLFAGLLRRSAGIHCPCSRATLRSSILQSLKYLSTNEESLPERVDTTIEGLIVSGDLLELNDVITEDVAARSTWVYAAPPSFVMRPNGDVFLFGIVADQDAFLPSSIADLIDYRDCSRVIPALSEYDISHVLRAHGLQQLTEKAWFKGPKKEAASKVFNRFELLLNKQPPSGSFGSLSIIDSKCSVSYYRGRWVSPTNHTGTFVARRPQEFGEPIWCFVRLENGVPVRVLDLPIERSRWRGCDIAWYLQMAIDFIRGSAQRYRVTIDGTEARFDFFSPIPQWSQRRLMIFGRSVPREQCLFSYILPNSEVKTEEQHLQQNLWLSPTR